MRRTEPIVSLRRSLPVVLLVAALGALGTLGCRSALSTTPVGVDEPPRPELVGYARIPPGDDRVAPVGGLSGLAWDERSRTLYAISDSKGTMGPPRIHRLRLSWGPNGGPRVGTDGWIPLTMPEAGRRSMDPEGVALAPGGGFFVSSEGWIERGMAPFVARFDGKGHQLEELPLPEIYRIGPRHGPRQNKVFEGLSVSPSGRYLFVGAESGLIQDGADATFAKGSVVRILRWDLAEHRWAGQYGYRTDPIHALPTPAGSLATSGLSELLALDDETLLVLERSYSQGPGFRVALYRTSLAGVRDLTDVQGGLDALPPTDLAQKELVVEFSDLGVPLDNYEGLAFGPRLPGGRPSLLVISDDNFDPRLQKTILVAFAWPE